MFSAPPYSRLIFPLLLGSLACARTSSAVPPMAAAPARKLGTLAQVLAASQPSDWRTLDPELTLYLELPAGRVVIELAPQFAPHHVDNLLLLARQHYFDGLEIVRVQDNYVVQWADADGKKPVGFAQRTLAAEFARPLAGLPFERLPDPDTYAPEVGFVAGFPAARDPASGSAWPIHCYGMVGAGRDDDADSGGGRELYAVIGHAPRQLDRNVTLLGRVVQGMPLLASLPRGTGELGFYETPAERTRIGRLRVAAELPEAERVPLQLLRTDTAIFRDVIESRRNRRDVWFKVPAGQIDICNVPLPVRLQP
jgi:peptidylprolyl isomerase